MSPLQRACIVLAYEMEMIRRWQEEAQAYSDANPAKVEVVDGMVNISWSFLPPPWNVEP